MFFCTLGPQHSLTMKLHLTYMGFFCLFLLLFVFFLGLHQ